MTKQVSKNVKRVSQVLGQPRKAASVAGVAQKGQHVGDHVTNKGSTGYRGEPLFGGASFNSGVALGNEVASKTQCGPGGSRTVMKSGSQGQQGAPRFGDPMPMTKGDLTKLDWKR